MNFTNIKTKNPYLLCYFKILNIGLRHPIRLDIQVICHASELRKLFINVFYFSYKLVKLDRRRISETHL